MSVGNISLTYTRSSLSVVSTTESLTIDAAPGATRAKPTIIDAGYTSQSTAARDGVTYTPASNSVLEEAFAAFYTATIGASNFGSSNFGARPGDYANYAPSQSVVSASGTLIQAAHESLGALIDILA